MTAMPGEAAHQITSAGPCRFCGAPLTESVVDLGAMPSANAYVPVDAAARKDMPAPLHAYVCGSCMLVQLLPYHTPEELFGDYAYFSSYSDSWLAHAKAYADAAIQRFTLGSDSHVIEVASNDGYLLQYFKERGIPVTGIEPAANVARAAQDKGVETVRRFFDKAMAAELADEGRQADLVVANNVLAHVPDINDFVAGLALAIKPDGVVSVEFPHLLRLIEGNQFDTIYHEHFSYFSFMTVERIFWRHGLSVFDLDELPTHGGSLRVYAGRANQPRLVGDRPAKVRADERAAHLERIETYRGFASRVRRVRGDLRAFLDRAKAEGKTVAGYGAPAKGNTLLNFCGVTTDDMPYTVDRNPAKQGTLLPGSRIPVHAPDRILENQPDYLLVLPWNLRDEVMQQMGYIRDWGGEFVIPIPSIQIVK